MPASPRKGNVSLSAAKQAPADKVIDQEETEGQGQAVHQQRTASEKADSPEEDVGDENSPPLPSREVEADGDDDVDAASEKEYADNLRRKRDREGSLEPSLHSQQGNTNTDTIPAKKNRLQDDAIKEEQAPSSSAAAPSSPSLKGGEGEKVGHIRKRVQDLSWKQRKEGDRDDLDEDKDGEDASAIDSKTAKETIAPPKKTQPSFSSYSSKPSAFASVKKSEAASPPASSPPDADRKTVSPPPNGRTQPTFSSFSKSSSPFSSMSNVAGPSWLAGKSGSGSPATGGGIRPSTLGSVGSPTGTSEEVEAISTPSTVKEDPSSTPRAPASPGSKQLGFGAFSSNKTFTSKGSAPTKSKDRQVNGDDSEESVTGKSFDEVLKQGKNNEEEVTASKVSIQLRSGLIDLKTGEEDEKTLTSARGKLYTMTEDKNWKERGTGTVRCNIAKARETSARLVMRSEGVLRLILNINLFKGMKINLEQDKFLRIVALEDEKLVHFAIKFANQATATNFYQVVKQMIPSDEQWDEEA